MTYFGSPFDDFLKLKAEVEAPLDDQGSLPREERMTGKSITYQLLIGRTLLVAGVVLAAILLIFVFSTSDESQTKLIVVMLSLVPSFTFGSVAVIGGASSRLDSFFRRVRDNHEELLSVKV